MAIHKIILRDRHGRVIASDSFASMESANVTIVDGVGTPSATADYDNGVLSITLYNIKGEQGVRGNGIASIERTASSSEDDGINEWTITDSDGNETIISVKNGSKGTDGIQGIQGEQGSPFTYEDFTPEQLEGLKGSEIVSVEPVSISTESSGTNLYKITTNHGDTFTFTTQNGGKGDTGDSAVYDPDDPDTPDFVMANTMGQSTTKAMTQKAVTDAIEAAEELCTEKSTTISTDLTSQDCSLGASSWYMDRTTKDQRHVAVDVAPGMIVSISHSNSEHGGYYAFLTSSYNPPYANNNAIPYVSGTSRVYCAPGEIARLTIPEGCKYLVLNTVDGASYSFTWTVTTFYTIKDTIADIGKKTDETEKNTMLYFPALDDAPISDWHITSEDVWEHDASCNAKIIDVSKFRGARYFIDGGVASCQFAFISLSPINGGEVRYCTGTGKHSEQYYDGLVPHDALLMYVVLDGCDPVVGIERQLKSLFSRDVFVNSEDVDLSQLTTQNCSIGTSTWFMAASNAQRHMALEVESGQMYEIRNTGTVTQYYAFLTSSYSPPVVKNTAIPYVEGSSRFTVKPGVAVYIEIPDGCAYLALNVVDGGGITSAYEVRLGTNYEIFHGDGESYSTPKIRVCSWNIGHFALGGNYDTTITHEEYPVMRQKWAETINDINADIMLCCEYNTNMVNAEGSEPAITARDAIFSPYKNAYVGTRPSATSYNQTAIFSNLDMANVSQVAYPHAVQTGRYYQYGIVDICGKHVAVVITHLDFNQGEHGAEYRAEQIQKLITDFVKYDHVIIAGDWNIESTSEYDVLVDAGYSMANHGYIGDLLTYPSGDAPRKYLDNIVCKGFKILNIQVVNDDELTDHCAIYADFTLI